jgi:hypothetical protein
VGKLTDAQATKQNKTKSLAAPEIFMAREHAA